MSELNLVAARQNMVESQIRPWEVLDQRVLDLMARAPRDEFVPPQYRRLAYADMNLPLGHGQVMMAPKIEARLLQALEIGPNDRILEVGTGSGFVTWLLANLGMHVYSVEIIPEFQAPAGALLATHGVANVTLDTGDAAHGWDRHAPYDVILLTGSVPILADAFRRSLAVGGRLAAIVGQPPVMDAKLIRRASAESFTEHSLFETSLPPLVNAPQPDRFVF